MILKITRLLFSTLRIGHVAFPTVVATLVYFIPCQEPFLGSILLSRMACQDSSTAVRIGLTTVEFAVLHYASLASGVYVSGLLFGGMIHLWFALGDIFDRGGELQVFARWFNSCIQDGILPVIISVFPAIQILGGFSCIRLRGGMNPMEFAFFAMETLVVIGYNLVFVTGAGKIYGGSVKWLRVCKGEENMRVNRKILASMTPLKVRFGQNFVDELTPLKLQEFCTIQTLNFLLLF